MISIIAVFSFVIWVSLTENVAAQLNSDGFSWRNFQWIDNSCHKYADRLDIASAEVESLLQTSIDSLGPDASIQTAATTNMRLAMFGDDDMEGRQPWSKFITVGISYSNYWYLSKILHDDHRRCFFHS